VDALLRLFEAHFGRPPAFLRPVVADGSRRRMVRMGTADGRTAIGVTGPEPEENRAFLAFSRTFAGLGLPVPAVYGADETEGVYLVEDLGDTTLFQALTAARLTESTPPGSFPASMEPVYRRVLEWLPRFQVEGGRAIDFTLAHPHESFDRTSMLWDLNYFKYHFLKLADVPFHERRLEEDFERLAAFLLTADRRHFLYRDFQSRNVMLRAAVLPLRTDEQSAGGAGLEPWFLDYQGGRRGALAYDVASLLYDAKAEIPPALRAVLLEHYLDALGERVAVDRARFHEQFRGYVLIRIMQAMGAYGYRGFYERKAHFLASVPPAVRNVRHLLADGPLPVVMPELRAVFERIIASDRLARMGAPAPERGLTVHVGSFSYRRGLPTDPGGNGGGFVFDCRGLENPHADPALAGLCGRDAAVASVLDASPEAAALFGHARAIIEAQVEVYLRRAWTSLSVQFGCTGGQHRSVYLAERMAAALRERFPDVRVRLEHAERARWPATADRPAAGAARTVRASA
jgi:aminoglycoside/choline kinase family phosphotransferase